MAVNSRRWYAAGVVLALLLAAAVLAWWWPGPRMAADPAAEHAMEPAAPARPPEATPRVAVTLDTRRQQLIGVRTAAVERRTVAPTVRTVGLVRYDETRLTDVNLKLEGWVRDLHVDTTGAYVRRGQPLFTLYSPDLVTTQNEYLLALRTRDQLASSQVADAREHADRLVDSARQRLTLWDLPPDQIAALERTREPVTAMTFRSPASGFVIEKQALAGMHVQPGQSLYKLADLGQVWVEADVYEQDMPLVRTGARAVVTLDAWPGESFGARVVFVYPYVEERTRSVKVRFALANRGGRLKPGMYANVALTVPAREALTVPRNAVLDSGTEQVVFVAEGDGYFSPRRVEVGQRLDDAIEVTRGLAEGEQVASGAAFFLDSESQLRASLQAYEPTPDAPGGGGTAARDASTIELRTTPDPPRSGETELEVTVHGADGRPVTDADVGVTFFMAAMPSMSMPAMRSEAALAHVGEGRYQGTIEVLMGGRWEVTVTAVRGADRLGTAQLSVVAR